MFDLKNKNLILFCFFIHTFWSISLSGMSIAVEKKKGKVQEILTKILPAIYCKPDYYHYRERENIPPSIIHDNQETEFEVEIIENIPEKSNALHESYTNTPCAGHFIAGPAQKPVENEPNEAEAARNTMREVRHD